MGDYQENTAMPNSVVKSLAKKSGKSVEEVERLWDKAANIAKKKGLSSDGDSFFAYTVGILKKMLKQEFLLIRDPKEIVEDYTDGTPHRLRAEPIGSASTIFKRDKFLRRRNDKDKKKKALLNKKGKGKEVKKEDE